MKKFVEVVNRRTAEVDARAEVTTMSEREVDAVEYGVNINLDHERYFTRIVEEKEAEHKVVRDSCGIFQNRPRFTCLTFECKVATLVCQPYMTEPVWEEKIKEFMKVHPCKEIKRV